MIKSKLGDGTDLDGRISAALRDADFVANCQNLSAKIIGRDCAQAELPTLCRVIHIIYCRIQFEESGSLEHAADAYRSMRTANIPIPDWLLPAIDELVENGGTRHKRRGQLDKRISLLAEAVKLKQKSPGLTQEQAAADIGIDKHQLCRMFANHPSIENPWKSTPKVSNSGVD
jgi:hypothetical protein